jgi:Uma2 family endonuclease
MATCFQDSCVLVAPAMAGYHVPIRYLHMLTPVGILDTWYTIHLEYVMTLATRPIALQLRLADEGTDIDLESIQGLWSVEQYLRLTNHTNRLIEYTDGYIEVLPMPTKFHQSISRALFVILLGLMERLGGDVFYAPMRIQIRPGKFREPDLLLVLDKNDPRAQDAYWLGADLVVEIVSPDRPERDLEEKPRDYAEVGIPEYWIVNPLNQTITILVLEEHQYRTHSIYAPGSEAISVLIPELRVAVDSLFGHK